MHGCLGNQTQGGVNMIHNIDNSQQLGYTASASYQRSVTAASVTFNSVTGSDNGNLFSLDQVNFSYFKIEESTTYSASGAIQSAAETAYDLLRGYVLDIFEKQGLDSSFSIGEETIDLETVTSEQAQELIADDGYFGIEQTSDRIVDFAIGISGSDPSRLDAILEGIEQGFNEALEAFGGWLPDISYDTYDAVLEKLDNWANTAQA